MCNFLESSKSLKGFEEPHAAREPQFDHPCYMVKNLG